MAISGFYQNINPDKLQSRNKKWYKFYIKLHKQMFKLNVTWLNTPPRTYRSQNQLYLYKRGRGVVLGTTEKQLQLQKVARAGIEHENSGIQVRSKVVSNVNVMI